MRPSNLVARNITAKTIDQLKECEAVLKKQLDLEATNKELEEKIEASKQRLKDADEEAKKEYGKVRELVAQLDELSVKRIAAESQMRRLADDIKLAEGKLIETQDARGTNLLKEIPNIIAQQLSKDRRKNVQLVLVSQGDGYLMGIGPEWTIRTEDGLVSIRPSAAVRPDMLVIVLRNNEQRSVKLRP